MPIYIYIYISAFDVLTWYLTVRCLPNIHYILKRYTICDLFYLLLPNMVPNISVSTEIINYLLRQNLIPTYLYLKLTLNIEEWIISRLPADINAKI